MTALAPPVESLYVIYDADGTRTGELIYMAKKLLGVAHCAACDITHGPRREKPEFTELKETWPVPVYNIHRDEMDSHMCAAVDNVLPCVVARTQRADVRVMAPEQLESCAGDVVQFARRVTECVHAAELAMPEKKNEGCKLRIRIEPPTVDVNHRRKHQLVDDEAGSESSNGDAVVPSPVY